MYENTTSFTLVVNGTQNNTRSEITWPIYFSIESVTTTFNETQFQISSQVATTSAGYAIITATSTYTPHFDAVLNPQINLTIALTDYVYVVSSTVILNIVYVPSPPYATNLPSSVSVVETVTTNDVIFTVQSADRDGDPQYYAFIDSSNTLVQTIYTYFTIDNTTGVISLNSPSFDVYVKRYYELPVMLYGPSMDLADSIAYLNVTLEEINRAPNFDPPTEPTTIVIRDDFVGSKALFNFFSTDREGDNVYYNITYMRPKRNPALLIEWGSYFLQCSEDYVPEGSKMFDYYAVPVYTLTIEAKDYLHLTTATSSLTLTVSVFHVDQPSEWVNLPASIYIQDDLSNGPVSIYTISATDPNNNLYGTKVRLEQIIPSSGNAKFKFDQSLKVFKTEVTPNFNYNSEPVYTAIFTCWNNVDPTITSSLKIHLVDSLGVYNENSSSFQTFLSEDSDDTEIMIWDIGKTTGRVNSSTTLTFIGDTQEYDGIFVIGSDKVVRTVDNFKFNYDGKTSYLLNIEAKHSDGTVYKTFSVTVSIQPVSRAPTFLNLPKTMWIEQGTNHRDIDLYQVLCADPRASVFYKMKVLPVSGTGNFEILSGGTIRTAPYANLSYMANPVFRVEVTCANEDFTATGTLTVYLSTGPVVLETTVQVTVVGTGTATVPQTTTPSTTGTVTYAPASGGTTAATSTELGTSEIAGIAGGIGGALIIAGIAALIAYKLRKDARQSGLTR